MKNDTEKKKNKKVAKLMVSKELNVKSIICNRNEKNQGGINE